MEGLSIETGICGNDQENSFMNATLQTHGDLEFSVATHVEVPLTVTTEEQLEGYLHGIFFDAIHEMRRSSASRRISFEIQLGPAGDGPEEGEEEDDV